MPAPIAIPGACKAMCGNNLYRCSLVIQTLRGLEDAVALFGATLREMASLPSVKFH